MLRKIYVSGLRVYASRQGAHKTRKRFKENHDKLREHYKDFSIEVEHEIIKKRVGEWIKLKHIPTKYAYDLLFYNKLVIFRIILRIRLKKIRISGYISKKIKWGSEVF